MTGSNAANGSANCGQPSTSTCSPTSRSRPRQRTSPTSTTVPSTDSTTSPICTAPCSPGSGTVTPHRFLTHYGPTRRDRPVNSTPFPSLVAPASSTRSRCRTWASSTAATFSWPRPRPHRAALTRCWIHTAISGRRWTRPPKPGMPTRPTSSPTGRPPPTRSSSRLSPGPALAGAYPLYLDAYELRPYAIYGAVPLNTIKKALLDLEAVGQLSRVRMLLLTNCTFDGVVYNPRRVMEEVLAIKPDICFLWDEAWYAFATAVPWARQRTAMVSAERLEQMLESPEYAAEYRDWAASMEGVDRSEWVDRRLLPDPARAAVRVDATHSTA